MGTVLTYRPDGFLQDLGIGTGASSFLRAGLALGQQLSSINTSKWFIFVMKKSVIEATGFLKLCTPLQKNKALGAERNAVMNSGFLKSWVVAAGLWT